MHTKKIKIFFILLRVFLYFGTLYNIKGFSLCEQETKLVRTKEEYTNEKIYRNHLDILSDPLRLSLIHIFYAIGKIHDIFNGKGVVKSVHTTSNMDGIDKTIEAMREDFDCLLYTSRCV